MGSQTAGLPAGLQTGRAAVRTDCARWAFASASCPRQTPGQPRGREGAKPLGSQTGKLRPGGKGFGIGRTAKPRYLTRIRIHALDMHIDTGYIFDVFYI